MSYRNKAKSLSDDKLIEQIIILAREYKQRFGKNLGITGEVGERLAAKLLKLERTQGNINKGFDAIDPEGKRVQIKTRIYRSGQERTSNFNNYDFDYALLVLLSDDYKVIEIYKAQRKAIKTEVETQSYKRPSLPIGRFKKIARCIYPI